MVLHYYYGGKHYTIIANWTDSDGKSAVFSDIIGKLQANYGPVFEKYRSTATELDAAVDKLYKHIYIFGDEHNALPYNPKFRKRFTEAYSAVCDILASCLVASSSEADAGFPALYMQILDKHQ